MTTFYTDLPKLERLAGHKVVRGLVSEAQQHLAKELSANEGFLEFNRASGDAVCEHCSKLYYDHPRHWPYLWLRILCDGKAVKL